MFGCFEISSSQRTIWSLYWSIPSPCFHSGEFVYILNICSNIFWNKFFNKKDIFRSVIILCSRKSAIRLGITCPIAKPTTGLFTHFGYEISLKKFREIKNKNYCCRNSVKLKYLFSLQPFCCQKSWRKTKRRSECQQCKKFICSFNVMGIRYEWFSL